MSLHEHPAGGHTLCRLTQDWRYRPAFFGKFAWLSRKPLDLQRLYPSVYESEAGAFFSRHWAAPFTHLARMLLDLPRTCSIWVDASVGSCLGGELASCQATCDETTLRSTLQLEPALA
jgi:hypothetical protein